MDMNQTRRSVLGTIGSVAAVAGTVGFSSISVFGANDGSQLVFTEVNEEGEYLIVKNTSGEEIDLSGYIVDFGFMDDDEGDEQKGTIAQGTTLDSGETLKIAPAAEKGDAGVETSREYVMPNDEEEVYAILSSDGTVVARSDRDRDDGEPKTTTTTEEDTTTTTETEATTTEDDSEESTSDETTDDSDDSESNDSSDDTQSDDNSESNGSESSGSGESKDSDSGDSSSEDDC